MSAQLDFWGGETKCLFPDLARSTAYKNGCRCPDCVDDQRRLGREEYARQWRSYAEFLAGGGSGCMFPALTPSSAYRIGCRCEERCAPAKRKQAREDHLRHVYGITVEVFNIMLAMQRGTCRVPWCVNTTGSRGGPLEIDHDHRTGRVRGLLCGEHNLRLGQWERDRDDMTFAWWANWYCDSAIDIDINGPHVGWYEPCLEDWPGSVRELLT